MPCWGSFCGRSMDWGFSRRWRGGRTASLTFRGLPEPEPELHFNVSHSGGLALCGAGEAPLGVDVEVLRPRRPGLARYVCSEAESAWLEWQGGDWGAFYTLWTLKEARVKCTGEGLRRPPWDIAVPLLRPGETGELDGLVFSAFSGETWRAAACCPTPQGPLELFVRNS